MKKHINKAFTLIELIVVIAILAILVLLGIPKMNNYQQQARLTNIKNNIKVLEDASERYYLDNQKWPRNYEEDVFFTKEQLETYAKEFISITGETFELDEEGKYYSIDYYSLNNYVQKPKDEFYYVIQNPIGKVIYLSDLTTEGDKVLKNNSKELISIYTSALSDFSYLNYKNKEIYGFGLNSSGQLGFEHKNNVTKPTKNANLSNVSEIFLGINNTFAITKAGDIYSWGNNTWYQLGLGYSSSEILKPTKIDTINNVKMINASENSTFFLTNDKEVYAVGWNGYGRLGLGHTNNLSKPTKITTLSNVKKIESGKLYTIALLENGDVYSWGGGNSEGALGLGHRNDVSTPTKISELSNIIDISTGSGHTLALDKNGDVYAWGSNYYGSLGINESKNYKTTPVKINDLSNIKAIYTGNGTSYVISSNDDVYSWGFNDYGQLGIGSVYVQKNIPTKVLNLEKVKKLYVGNWHVFALTENNDIYAWGESGYGQLGNGNITIDISTPTKVSNEWISNE